MCHRLFWMRLFPLLFEYLIICLSTCVENAIQLLWIISFPKHEFGIRSVFVSFSSSSSKKKKKTKISIVLLWVFSKLQSQKRFWKWQCSVWYLFSHTDFHIKMTKLGRQKMFSQLLATQSSFVFWLFSFSYININKHFVGETEMSVFWRSNQVQFIPCSVIIACFCEESKPIPSSPR